jgi:hypothetical protein
MEIPCVVWCYQYLGGGDVYKVSTVRVLLTVLSEHHCVSLHRYNINNIISCVYDDTD